MTHPIKLSKWRGLNVGVALAIAIGALGALGVMGFSSPAAASDVRVNLNLGWNGGYGYPRAHHKRYYGHHRPYVRRHYGGHHSYRRPHHRSHNQGYYRKPHRSYYNHSDGRRGHRNYSSYGAQPCHPVNKEGRWHGRPAKIGGTMCYNRYGKGYIASGSRYLIHYY